MVENYSFSVEGGARKVDVVSSKTHLKPKGTARWEFLGVCVPKDQTRSNASIAIPKDWKSDEHTMAVLTLCDSLTEAKEQLLPDGSYIVDAGWVKFRYPKNRHEVTIETLPNPDERPRYMYFKGPWKAMGVFLYISQEGRRVAG